MRMHTFSPNAVGSVETRSSISLPSCSVLMRPSWGRRFSAMSMRHMVLRREVMARLTILKAFPVVIADNAFFPKEQGDTGQGNARARKFFQKALEQLGDIDKVKTMARSRKGKVHLLEDVVRTNSF